ncbi:hypothetical protein [Bradyrhizobium sp. 23]|uniref:hypothetical protein n=1 Tax=Bradyrhizobium sp. 23 TaxID=2782667 RepID=UPI001FFA979F|nr:hypothetical protein [Bradyrhizobium sp. 23]MCK1312528.1 hypothetical protein [Bradyrhizobium sp. 23]
MLNVRIHGTTGEAPIARLARDEAHRLKRSVGNRRLDRRANRPASSVTCAFEIDTIATRCRGG